MLCWEVKEMAHQLVTAKQLLALLAQVQASNSNLPPLLIDFDAAPECSRNDLMPKADAKDLETLVQSRKLGDVGDERGDPGCW